jgi:hypothetical protein
MKLLALLATVVAVLAGLWVFGSPLSRAFADATGVPAYWSSIAFAVAWFVLASIVLGKVRKERPELNVPLRAGFLATAAVVGGVFAWTLLTDDKASDDVSFAKEAVPVAVGSTTEGPKRSRLVSDGSFSGIDHDARGRARLVILPSGERRLAFTDFDVERAPDLHVYLAVDAVEGDVGEYKRLGTLKGNVGDQYYVIPKSVDLKRYDNVVIWCRAFDVGVAQAALQPV